jgi:hypothetical protein
MTLLLTLAAPWGIYQCSDYRLTTEGPGGTAIPEDDELGAKQLTASSPGAVVVQVCFTGLPRFGSEKTRNWISEILATTSHPIDIDRVASEIAMRGTRFVKRAPPNVKALTVLIAAAKVDQNLRLILVSNIDRLGDRRLATPLDSLEVDSVTPSRPALFVHGYDVGVSQNDRKFLKSLLRRDSHSKSVMDGLSAVNVRTAQNGASNGRISEGCMASSLLADGIHTSFNYGE